jgi:hypothetical protein
MIQMILGNYLLQLSPNEYKKTPIICNEEVDVYPDYNLNGLQVIIPLK